MFSFKSILDVERHSLFFINLILVFIVMITFFYSLPMTYFFYTTMIVTLVGSYIYFKRSKQLSKALILTNMFFIFYFLSVPISFFIFDLLDFQSYYVILLYNLIVAFIFLIFSGNHNCFQGNIQNFSWFIFIMTILLGLAFGALFVFLNEPASGLVLDVVSDNVANSIVAIASIAFLVALTEQFIFSAFFYNIYKVFISRDLALFYSAILFVLFHSLTLNNISYFYSGIDSFFASLFIAMYYVALFFFMFVALYLYRFKTKKYDGIFLYPLTLHFFADFVLFMHYYLFI